MSKGGQCVYSGRPQQLSQHLSDCGIYRTKAQLPIEVLLKYSCNESNDKFVDKMIEKTKTEEKEKIKKWSSDELQIYPDGIIKISKRFYLRDLWLLLNRAQTYTLRFYWKIILFEFCFYISFALVTKLLFDPNIGIPSGCISFDDDFNNTCAKTDVKIDEENRIITNMNYNFFQLLVVVIFTLSLTILSFSMDFKIFFNEQRNGM